MTNMNTPTVGQKIPVRRETFYAVQRQVGTVVKVMKSGRFYLRMDFGEFGTEDVYFDKDGCTVNKVALWVVDQCQ